MIYLDNSATSYPKPEIVRKSVYNAFNKYGANSGRGAYEMAVNTTEEIFKCRQKVCSFFNAESVENVIFTYNCTTSLNMAIKGIAKKGSHFIISDLEHNAVVRPLEKLRKTGIAEYSVARVENDCYSTIRNFKRELKRNTAAIICTGASNVFGIIPPYRQLSDLAHKNGLLFIMDCAQIGGVISVDMQRDGIDILCCAGHKGLMGPSGTGILILSNNILVDSLIEGGTGSNSVSSVQPDILPDKFESGTPNVQGIIGLSGALDFINHQGVDYIYNHEKELIKYLQKHLACIDKTILYTDFFSNNIPLSPILSFNIKNMHSEEVAQKLSQYNIATRAGIHCAPLAHKKFLTLESGTVRISPSIFTKKSDIDLLINCINKIAKLN